MRFDEQYIKNNYMDFLDKEIPFPFYFFKDLFPDYWKIYSKVIENPRYAEYLDDQSEEKTFERIDRFIKNYPQHKHILLCEGCQLEEIEFDDLQKELADLLFEYEELTTKTGPAIEYRYAKLFGLFEIELYQLEMEFSMVKMKIMEIQKYINRQEEIPLGEIEEKIRAKYKKHMKKIEEDMEDYEELMKLEFMFLSKEEYKEMKKKYKTIIKKLHPDLNKNLTEKEKVLLIKANAAYELHDMNAINQIYEILKGKDSYEILDDDYLKKQVEKMKKKIKKYKESFPYNKKDVISNSEEIDEYKNYLKDQIRTYKRAIIEYNLKLEKMIENEPTKN